MSYRVDYNPEMMNRYPQKIIKKIPIRRLLIPSVVIVACYMIYSSGLFRLLIPGDPAVTSAAFTGMVDDIGAGESVRQAFLAFCKEIIIHAG